MPFPKIGQRPKIIWGMPTGIASEGTGQNLELAIACYQAALQVRTQESFPENWATTQNNLGNAYYDRIRGERREKSGMAIACYEAALQVRTPESFPEKWATTQNNLGTAYLAIASEGNVGRIWKGRSPVTKRLYKYIPQKHFPRLGSDPK